MQLTVLPSMHFSLTSRKCSVLQTCVKVPLLPLTLQVEGLYGDPILVEELIRLIVAGLSCCDIIED